MLTTKVVQNFFTTTSSSCLCRRLRRANGKGPFSAAAQLKTTIKHQRRYAPVPVAENSRNRWPIWTGTGGRFTPDLPADLSGIGNRKWVF